LGARVVAVEPDPRCAAILSRRFAREIADGRLVLVPCAIGTRPGTVRLEQYSTGGLNASASPVFAAAVRQPSTPVPPSVEVAVIEGGSLFDQFGDPQFVKV